MRPRLTDTRSIRMIALVVALIGTLLVVREASSLNRSRGAATPVAPATTQADPDPWEPFRLLAGTWEARIDGRLGQGTGRRRYEFILDNRYLLSRHASVRLPQEASPEGDYHRELAVYSLDTERQAIVLREFFVEGYVLRSVCNTVPQRLVCTAEAIESGPGMQARLTIEFSSPFEFVETYELASPGEELQVYFTNTFVRVPDLRDLP